ncbi:MAG: MCP four helix bundle domain-containing protein [Azospirillaceae bacterium]|nr:MCP four helix bundle domain-containing protein [Azospirillaceae bacterium]
MAFASLPSIRIRTRLVASAALLLLFLAALGIISAIAVERVSRSLSAMYDGPLRVSRAVLAADIEIISIHRSMKDVILAPGDAQIDAAVADVAAREQRALAQIDRARAAYRGDPKLLDPLRQALVDWKPLRDRAEETGRGVGRVFEVASALSRHGDALRGAVAGFVGTLVAAPD